MANEESFITHLAAYLQAHVRDAQVDVDDRDAERLEGFSPDLVVRQADTIWIVELKVGEGPLDTTDLAQLRGYQASRERHSVKVMLATTRKVSERLRSKARDWNVTLVTGGGLANLESAVARTIVGQGQATSQ